MINMDFTQRVVVESSHTPWLSSPAPGVWRKPLEREEKESGHTTSIVKYDAGSHFARHFHPKGEEIYVLEGVFSDEHGHYPAGSYIRNPPGSAHTPYSQPGCVIFVKLNQFDRQDAKSVVIDTTAFAWLPNTEGLHTLPLHQFGNEQVTLITSSKGEHFQHENVVGGQEVLVLSGVLQDEFGTYPAGTWLRSPCVSQSLRCLTENTTMLMKTGHLPIDE